MTKIRKSLQSFWFAGCMHLISEQNRAVCKHRRRNSSWRLFCDAGRLSATGLKLRFDKGVLRVTAAKKPEAVKAKRKIEVKNG
jgi:hypothetical protein